MKGIQEREREREIEKERDKWEKIKEIKNAYF